LKGSGNPHGSHMVRLHLQGPLPALEENPPLIRRIHAVDRIRGRRRQVVRNQPAGLRKGTLFVNVDSSVWLSEIVRYRRKEILDRLQHSFGREIIKKISFRVG